MRKNFLLIAGVAAILASCSKTETVERPETAGIRFDGAYIGYSTETRAFTEIDDLSEFWVYGQYTKDDASTVTVFTNDKVTEGGGENVWTYEGGQRPWINGATYTFAAYAPQGAVSAEGLNDNGYLTFTCTSDQNNQEDLLYAAYTQNGQAESNEPIALIFKHLLSNVQFTFKNGFDKTSEVNVSDIQVTGIATQATFTGNTITGTGDENFGGDWDTATGNGTFALTDQLQISAAGSSDGIVVIPQSVGTVSVTFDVEVKDQNGQIIASKDKISVNLPNETTTAWAKGYRYNYVATITPESVNLEYIEFEEPSVDKWTPSKDDVELEIPVSEE